ncbi:MAG TPA: phage integrase N-terminal SAM-like domain-containing protein [Casimicrobium huifangae]|nr:phage integrase N-terminal SAM-like domain-containing protein [Casimicrobium huifangae]HQA34075.1 phage integrase N-terminal SAM-like domain-containing protein [Casimicrobium huifangae]
MKSSSPGADNQTPNARVSKRGKVPKEKGARGKVLVPKGRIRLPRKAEGKVRRLMGAVRARVDGARNRRNALRGRSFGTREYHCRLIGRFLRFLAVRGELPNDVERLSMRHFREYLSHLGDPATAASPSTLANNFCALRSFFEDSLGKRNCIDDFADYFPEHSRRSLEEIVDRSVSAQRDEDGNPYVAEELIERVEQVPRYGKQAAAALQLSLTLGVRIREAVCMQPRIQLSNIGARKFVEVRATGAKNGRRRCVFFLDAENPLAQQALAALHNAASLCDRVDGTLFREDRIQQALDRVYATLRKAGLTKDRLGVTAHSFRHEFALRCWLQAGHAAPHRAPLTDFEQTAVGLALREVDRRVNIERLGHSRPTKLDAYLGSFAKQRDRSGISQAQRIDAGFFVRDIERGDVVGAVQRQLELRVFPLERVRAQIEHNLACRRQHFLPLPAGVQVPLTVSIGVDFNAH